MGCCVLCVLCCSLLCQWNDPGHRCASSEVSVGSSLEGRGLPLTNELLCAAFRLPTDDAVATTAAVSDVRARLGAEPDATYAVCLSRTLLDADGSSGSGSTAAAGIARRVLKVVNRELGSALDDKQDTAPLRHGEYVRNEWPPCAAAVPCAPLRSLLSG
jgi:hypothetical protein